MDLPYDPIPPYVEAEPDAPPRPSSTAPTGASVRQEVAASVVPAAHADWFAFGGPDPTEAPAGPAGGREPMAAAAPDGPHPGRTWAIGLGAVALAVLAFFGARAVSGHKAATATATSGPAAIPGGLGGRRPGTAGTIARIDGSTLTLTDSTGQSIKVVTGASTTVTSSAPARLTDIAAGDRLTVIGTASTTNAIAATTVTDTGTIAGGGPGGNGAGGQPGAAGNGAPPGGPAPANATGGPPGRQGANGPGGRGFAAGTAIKVEGTTIIINTTAGTTVTVSTSATTIITNAQPTSVQALRTGESVVVRGTTASDGTVTATAITEGANGLGGGFGPPPTGGLG